MTAFRLLLLSLLLFLAPGCGERGADGVSVPMADAPGQSQAFGDGAWLRERLPADTISYVRLPSPWRTLLGPADKRADHMYASAAWVAAVNQVRAALGRDALVGESAEPAMGLLYRIASPVEVAVIVPGRMASPAANVYATVRLDYPDANALAGALSGLLDGETLAFDAEGYAGLPQAPAPIFVHFDAAERRLSLLGGAYATLDALKAQRAQIAAEKLAPRPELALEREIDAGGLGMVWWADIEALRPLLAAGVQDEAGQAILGQTRRLAYGWGSADGVGRLAVRAELAPSAWTKFLPQSPRRLDLSASGRVRFALSATLPTADDLNRIGAGQNGDDEFAVGWREAEKFSQEKAGLKLADWLAPFGPDLVIHADDAGDFLSVRLRDAAAWQRLREVLIGKFQASYRSHSRNGAVLHELRLPSLVELLKALGEKVGDSNPLGAQLYARVGTRLWWLEQDGWLVFAGVPQPLIDRAVLGASERIDARFAAAGVNATALAVAAADGEDVARRSYHFWIGLLDQLGELAGTQLELPVLPTARELGLPQRTPFGAAIELTPERFGLELGYSLHPFEALGGSGGIGAVAMAGILAAIAIPAYQDYTLRATVAEALSVSSSLKSAIAEHHAAKGEIPSDAATLGMDLPLTHRTGTVNIDGGAVLIRFDDNAPVQLRGKYLYLLPRYAKDNLRWDCGRQTSAAEELLITLPEGFEGTDIESRYLPSHCR